MVAPQKKVYFFFLSGAKKGKIESAPAAGSIRIGRQHDSTVQLDPYEDIPASGDHAQVVCEGDERFFLEDRGSSWGTFKNDVPVVGRVPLATGDVITCGQDAQGKQGPRLKFYLEKDVLRCPACDGPVYKRHFKCPGCSRKFCLRCIDFKTKTCKPCAPRAAPAATVGAGARDSGFELVEDDEPVDAKRPARVVVSGKDARRFKRAQEKEKQERTAPARGKDPGVVAEPVDLDAPFCSVCCEFAEGPTFVCPACRQTCCVSHRQGVVCPPCAGVAAGAPDPAVRASEPELVVPDLDDVVVRRPAASPPASPRAGVEASGRRAPAATTPATPPSGSGRAPAPASGGLEDTGRRRAAPGSPSARGGGGLEESGRRRQGPGSGAGPAQPPAGIGSSAERPAAPSTMRLSPPPAAADDVILARPDPGAGEPPALRAEPLRPPAPGGRAPSPPPDPLLTRSKIDARRPPAIPCERCASPLSATSFFICERCRARLCGQHRAPSGGARCDRCSAPRSPFDAAAGPLPYAGVRPPVTAPPTPSPGPVPPTGRPPGPPPGLPARRPPAVPQDLIETAGDDVLPPARARPPARPTAPPARPSDPLGLSGSGGGPAPLSLSGSGVRFECPYCDEQLPAGVARCRRCQREL